MIPIDWSQIRPIDGSQDAGFEEICAQLARSDHPEGFVRKGAPDAGVECFAVRYDGSEWAWQAKYFDSLEDTQWGQLDKSVRTALEKHPKLTRYFVCVPYDRPDARTKGKKSALEKWYEHVAKWAGWAKDRGMAVEFEYWGSSELLERLHKPEHAGRVLFWFGVAAFDGPWFKKRLDEGLKAAGPRYTPEIHIELPIAHEFDSFGRAKPSVGRAKAFAKAIRAHYQESVSPYRQPEQELGESPKELEEVMGDVFSCFSELDLTPTGAAPYRTLARKLEGAEQMVDALRIRLEQRELEYDARPVEPSEAPRRSSSRTNPYRVAQNATWDLASSLGKGKRALDHQADLAEGQIMVVQGQAGTGKTHLLCDVARCRLDDGMPTVLLMGQRFTSTEQPWTQLLQMVDLPNATAEEFVGALESSAQAANVRALVMIDAVNEGKGREIWPEHMDSFLAVLTRSPWVGVVLSVRTSYEEWILPEAVRQRATAVEHRGFQGREYDALKSYLQWYGIEMPSTPLLDPEFSNPLFLKALCSGLKGTGQRRLPRGHQGITTVFNLYLDAVQGSLTRTLDLNPRAPLVRRAVEAFSSRLAETQQRWLPQSVAETLVNGLLPGRDFSRSLYRGLIDEGVLTVDASVRRGANEEEVVYIAYERLADHQIVRALLDKHFHPESPGDAFVPGAPLHSYAGGEGYTPEGVLEALSIQIPERCATEFAKFVPDADKVWGLGQAFAQSIAWRAPDAFNDDTLVTFDDLVRTQDGLDRNLDALVTVATLPEHKLNAEFLDWLLRRHTMPERDAWWSTYVHRAWQNAGALYRTAQWAWSLSPAAQIEDGVVDLAALVLSWTFTTSNRYARDRATKALVSLLTGRLGRAAALVRRFADVDDLYVTERVYAVAYGVAMRCHRADEIAELAQSVYDAAFAEATPPTHILLRDYARGVVERALFLGGAIDVDEGLIRPPYRSDWPHIPTEEEVEQKSAAASSKGEQPTGDFGRKSIFSSVGGFGDFARYVIGTNGPHTDWLSLRLDDPKWRSRKAEIEELLDDFSGEEKRAYETYREEHRTLLDGLTSEQLTKVQIVFEKRKSPSESASEGDSRPDTETMLLIEGIERSWEASGTTLEAALTREHAERLQEVLNRPPDESRRRGPRFDLSIIQRYVLGRVFDLGWTDDRFDYFDHFHIGYDGRSAQKAERIGKKYQWIAYHEIIAMISDHFQHSEEFGNEPAVDQYEGPWQESLRDIDPSCGLAKPVGGTGYDGHDPAWWSPVEYSNWADKSRGEEWAKDVSDLPDPMGLLVVTDPSTGVRWLNLDGCFRWVEETPQDRESSEVDHQGIRYNCDALLVRADDVDQFVEWAKGIDFEMSGMPDAPQNYRIFVGEHPWAPAAQSMRRPYEGEEDWTTPAHNCPVEVRAPSFHYLKEMSTFDCSVDETYVLRLPAWDLIKGMGLHWSGADAEYRDAQGSLVAFDPTARSKGPTALLVREDALRDFLIKNGFALCWTVSGEKRLFLRSYGSTRPEWTSVSGVYRLTMDTIEGSFKGIVRP